MLTPQQRRELVERPFGQCRYIYPVKRWAGVQVQDMDSFFRGQLDNTRKGSYAGREVDTRTLEKEVFSGR